MPKDDVPEDSDRAKLLAAQGELMHKIAAHFSNCYVIDLHEYMPVQDEKYKERFYLEGHLNACGYMFTAQVVMSYIDYIIRHNIKDFRRASFINTAYADSKLEK